MPRQASRILLLTGPPGVGKTTAVLRVSRSLAGWRLGGFYTQEMRTHGTREGFRLVSFDGRSAVIAHIDFPKVQRVGKYGVDVRALDEAADTTLAENPGRTLYLIDEIGKMECLSTRFLTRVRSLLSGRHPMIATVALRGTGFIAEVKHWPHSSLWQINRDNREAMPQQVLRWLGATVPAGKDGR